ncbi:MULTISPECIES: type I-F CRISPR-associated protein Csy2 [unclassified Moraxella]|uniref:type I-F CRISPR-associated protein Csy2 n=1 Tax=unclassified Moraxella TaxID=2685852 RepID=UPI003AF99A49
MSYIYPERILIGYLLLENMTVINANAISSPLTYGFPAVTGFTGAVHALSRKVGAIEGLDEFALDGVLIACQDCQVQAYRESPFKDFTFIQTRNPILKSGKTASIVEEGRCHLKVSLLIGVYRESRFGLDEAVISQLCDTVKQLAQQQRWAGGSVTRLRQVSFIKTDDLDSSKTKLYPAFVLMDAYQDLLDITDELTTANPKATLLDALIETATLHHIPNTNNSETHWQNTSVKSGRGWLVPMPIGFQGISPIFAKGEMANSRNPEYPSQYVESLYSLGKWQFPNSINDLSKALWYQRYDAEQSLYLVTQQSQIAD